MRVSEYYGLEKTQSSLRFVDVDIKNDIKLFINANAIRSLDTDWSKEAEFLISDYFSAVIGRIISGDSKAALRLLSELREPNETHLGLSKGQSKGRGLGTEKAREIWTELKTSAAVRSGQLTDLEDTVLLIDGVSVDTVSDIITNIIRGPLIRYTQETCDSLQIDMSDEVVSGPIWDHKKQEWYQTYVRLPTPNGEKLLLVPKAIVRLTSDYDVSKYYRHFILPYMQEEEKKKNSSIVRIIKTGKKRGEKHVTKTDLRDKYGTDEKRISIEKTNEAPHLLADYKAANSAPTSALSHRQISDAIDVDPPDWDALLADVISLKPGRKSAYKYEDAVINLMEALFYPSLVEPHSQSELHDGLKRVDITFSNYARDGFFYWLRTNYRAPFAFIECKNFGSEIGNPEFDQLAMRFSKDRGQFGILVCRSIKNKSKVKKRCKAAAVDGHGYIVVLDDC